MSAWQLKTFHVFKTGENQLNKDSCKLGCPGGSDSKESAMQETKFNPWVRKIPWRRKWQPTPVFLCRESHEQRNLVGWSPWGYKELDTTEQLHFSLFINYKGIFLLKPSKIPKVYCKQGWVQSMVGEEYGLLWSHSLSAVWPWASYLNSLYSSILAWRGHVDRGAWQATQSIGSQRVGLDWVTKHILQFTYLKMW